MGHKARNGPLADSFNSTGKILRPYTFNGTLNLFARVEQGGLGVRRPPGIEPGWTYYQKSLAPLAAEDPIDCE